MTHQLLYLLPNKRRTGQRPMAGGTAPARTAVGPGGDAPARARRRAAAGTAGQGRRSSRAGRHRSGPHL